MSEVSPHRLQRVVPISLQRTPGILYLRFDISCEGSITYVMFGSREKYPRAITPSRASRSHEQNTLFVASHSWTELRKKEAKFKIHQICTFLASSRLRQYVQTVSRGSSSFIVLAKLTPSQFVQKLPVLCDDLMLRYRKTCKTNLSKQLRRH